MANKSALRQLLRTISYYVFHPALMGITSCFLIAFGQYWIRLSQYKICLRFIFEAICSHCIMLIIFGLIIDVDGRDMFILLIKKLYHKIIGRIFPFIHRKQRENAYELSNKYGNDTCGFCLCKFDINTKQSLLVCGHRYHTKCLSDWEKPENNKCGLCNTYYNDNTKWEYDPDRSDSNNISKNL